MRPTEAGRRRAVKRFDPEHQMPEAVVFARTAARDQARVEDGSGLSIPS